MKTPTRRRRAARRTAAALAACAAAWLAAAPPASADQLVVFLDTRTLRVDDAVLDENGYLLDLGGGNTARVPADQVLQVKPLPVEPPDPSGGSAWRSSAGPYERFIEAAAREFGLDPALLLAVAVAESALDPAARSHKGALGVMQIMPATARELGLANPFDAKQNIEAGARFLREMIDLFEGDLDLALAAYNAGQGTVRRYGGVPPFPETREYLARVRALVDEWRRPESGL